MAACFVYDGDQRWVSKCGACFVYDGAQRWVSKGAKETRPLNLIAALLKNEASYLQTKILRDASFDLPVYLTVPAVLEELAAYMCCPVVTPTTVSLP